MEIDDATFAAMDALLDDGLCLCEVVVDGAGRAVDCRFLRVSRRFAAATGLHDAAGRTALELVPGLERSWVEACARVGLDRETLRFTPRSAPMGRVFDVLARPVEPHGRFAVLFRDVSDLHRLEAELLSAQGLLKELTHRVMNSFAAISAVTALEARAAPPEARPALGRLQGRVQALGALYRRLDGAAHVDRVEASEYLGGIVDALDGSVTAAGARVRARIAPASLPTRAAVPLGLVVNELVTAGASHGAVDVAFLADPAGWRLTVEGAGFAGLNEALVGAFVTELSGTLTLRDGTASLAFPAPREEQGDARAPLDPRGGLR